MSDFKKMYENVVVDILEQPAERNTRFRYSCEGKRGETVLGLSSTQDRKTYPAIRVLNYTGAAVVVVSCVSKDEPFRPHPHALVGNGCSKGVCTIEFHTSESAPTTITFKEISIQCCRKNDIEKMLTERETLRIDPFRTGFQHKNAKYSEIDASAVRLCFQVLLRPCRNEGVGKSKMHSINPVVSNPILDKKSVTDLLIYDISDTTSPINGQKKIMIFCDKVAKNDIKIRFYRKNGNNSVEWEGWGEFKPRDVHHQYAIAFRTPPYITNDIENPVDVFVQLVRPSDGRRSNSILFQYIPNVSNVDNSIKSKKRKIEESAELSEYVLAIDDEQLRQSGSSKMVININPMSGCKGVNIEPSSYQSNFNLPCNQLHSYTHSHHPQQPSQSNYLHQSDCHSYHQQPQASSFQKPLGSNNFQQELINNQTQGYFQPHNQHRHFSQQPQISNIQQQPQSSKFSQPQNGHLQQPRPLSSTFSQQQPLTRNVSQQQQNGIQQQPLRSSVSHNGHLQQLPPLSSTFSQQPQIGQPQQQPQNSNFSQQQQPQTNNLNQQQYHLPLSSYNHEMYSNFGYDEINLAVNYKPVSCYSSVDQQNNSTPQNLNQFHNSNTTSVNQQCSFEKNIFEDVENISDSFSSLLL